MSNKTKLICGVGLNDANYKVYCTRRVEGKLVVVFRCPYYVRWSSMIERCYSEPYLNKHPKYKDTTVCEEWLLFSNFKSWMEKQDWEYKHLDKDLLGNGKLYSPDTCCFITETTNYFLKENKSLRGDFLLGVHKIKTSNKFRSSCSNPFNQGDKCFLGSFDTEIEAHLAWRVKKHEIACELAKLETDVRAIEALTNRYKQDIYVYR